MAGEDRSLALRVSLGVIEIKTISPSSRATHNRCCAPQTVLEKRVASVCSRLPEVRPVHEVKWLASHLRRIPTLQHVPAWKLESLGRNMTAEFAREGDDACLLCADPAFSYFLVSGSLMPIEATSVHAAPSLSASAPFLPGSTSCSLRGAPTVEVAAVTEPSKAEKMSTRAYSPKGAKARKFLRPVACEVEKPPGLAVCSCTYPHDTISTISGSALTPAHGNGGEKMGDGADLGSAVSKSLFSVPMTTPAEASTSPSAPHLETTRKGAKNGSTAAERVEGCPSLPGHSLDPYLLHELVSAAEETGPDGGNHAEAGRPEVVSAFPEGLNGDATDPRRWRLEAQERVCIGRASLRFLKELELEEPKHDVEMKVAFLRRTEVFGDGFSLVILQRLAVLMERQEQAEATVIRRKGAVVDKVVMIESGEAIRLGDPQADSMKTYSSLRIRTGQMFGAEEALLGMPVYTGNLMTVTSIRFFAIPTAAFLQATNGVWTKRLYRLRSRARVMSHGCSARSGGQRQRPSTATGVGSKRSDSRNWSSGASGEKSLAALTPSKTKPTPLTLAPVPLFSGSRAESGLEERMKTLAACWAPWSWPGDDDSPPSQAQERRDHREQAAGEGGQRQPPPPISRPQSAPATPTGPSAPAQLRQAPPPEGGGEIEDDGITSRSPHKASSVNSHGTGDLPLSKRTGVPAGAPRGAPNRARGGAGERGESGEQASPASPDFRRLGPSGCRSTQLAGCGFNALPVEFLDRSRPAVAVDSGGGRSKFRPEALMARRWSSSGSKGAHNARHGQRTKTKKKKTRQRPATIRPTTAPAADLGGRGASEDKGGVGWLNAPLGERPPLLLGGRSGGDSGMQIVGGGVDGVGDDDSGDSDDSGSGLIWKGIGRAPPSLSTHSSPSRGSTSTPLAATLELWTKRDVAAARRAVSYRPQRTRLCLALKAHESTSAGMAAAQRSHRGAFVMSKMGDARARSTWRPLVVREAVDVVGVL